MDKELMEQFSLLAGMMEKMDGRISGIESEVSGIKSKVSGIESEVRGIKSKVSNIEFTMVSRDNIDPRALLDEGIETISDRSASKVAAIIENTLGKRIDSLFDGYKLTHEKQYELERRVDKLERLVAELQNRIA
ncbi:MAG: hypothetical protein FWH00_05285 [Oscillospiraceae bacterium]|nr:hypothetical protein [Oscillospiraceae bacterium]